jgi:peptidyl-prolyl cis-trans isomerase C
VAHDRQELEPTQVNEIRSQALREFRIEQLIVNSDEGRDVHVPDSVVEEALERIVARYTEQETFLQDLDDNGLNETSFREAIARELHATAVLDKVGSRSVEVSEIDCMIYFYMHKEKFEQPETRELRHILITINEEFPENKPEAAYARLSAIRQRLKSKPKRFAEQAMKHSECPTALQGGYLGKLPRGQLFPAVEEVAFKLKPGRISEIVQSPIGYHLLYCEAVHDAGPVGFREAEAKIQDHLKKRRSRMCQKVWLSELTKNHETQERDEDHDDD